MGYYLFSERYVENFDFILTLIFIDIENTFFIQIMIIFDA